MEYFIDRLEKILKEKEISKTELAEKIGIRRPTISDWKKNGAIPSGDVCLKIARYLDVSPEWLLGGEERKGGEAVLSEEEKSILRQFKNLTEEQKSTLSALLEHYEKANNEALKRRLG